MTWRWPPTVPRSPSPGRRTAAGIDQVYLREYSGGTWNSLAGSASGNGISNSSRDARAPTLAYSGGSLFAAWQDDSSNYWEIDAVTYNGTSWMPAGLGAASGGGVSNTQGSATEPRLASSGGKLYLLWADDRIQNLTGNTIALYVKQWNGTAFVEALPGDASGQGISDTGGRPAGAGLHGRWQRTSLHRLDRRRRERAADQRAGQYLRRRHDLFRQRRKYPGRRDQHVRRLCF